MASITAVPQQAVTITTASNPFSLQLASVSIQGYSTIGAISIDNYVLTVTNTALASNALTLNIYADDASNAWWQSVNATNKSVTVTKNVTIFVYDTPPASKTVASMLKPTTGFNTTQRTVNIALPYATVSTWDLRRLQALILPGVVYNYPIFSAIDVNTSDNTMFMVTLNVSSVQTDISNAQNVLVVYNTGASYTTTVNSNFTSLVDTIRAVVSQYLQDPKNASVLTNVTESSVATLSGNIASSLLLDHQIGGIVFQVGSDAYNKAVDVLTYVVKQMINDVMCNTTAQPNQCGQVDPKYQSLANTTALSGSQCGINSSDVFCSPFMANVYNQNVVIKENINYLQQQIDDIIGQGTQNVSVANAMAAQSQTYQIQNRNIVGAVEGIINSCKTTHTKIIVYCGAILFVCVMNIVVSFFINAENKFYKFIAFFFLFAYIASFTVVVVFGTTTKS